MGRKGAGVHVEEAEDARRAERCLGKLSSPSQLCQQLCLLQLVFL